MSTSAIVCAECQNPWPQGAAVCPACGSRVSHVGATGVHPARAAAAIQAAPAAQRTRGANPIASANGLPVNASTANGSTAPEVAAALEAGIGLRGQTFVIERVLRRGGFCIAYAARVAGLEQSAVVQELVPPGCARRNHEIVAMRMAPAEFERIKQRYETEAHALTSFSHPGIVAARLVFAENNTLYLAMERAPGQTLQERIEESGPLMPEQAVEVISQIGAMIVALHEAGLAHGDIRPANVSLSRAVAVEAAPDAAKVQYAWRAMLNDWGLERWLEESYVVTGAAESAASPESDVAGLAATLFFALTGQRPPATAQDAARLLGLTASSEATTPDAPPIDRSLAEAVLRGLARDAQPALTARAFLQLLQQTATPQPARTPAPPRNSNRTPFDALLSGQKPNQKQAGRAAAPPIPPRAEAESEARPAPAAAPRIEKRWIQDVALSVGGAILVGLAAWLLTTQTGNHQAPPTPSSTFVAPTAATNSDSNATNAAALPAATPAAANLATLTPTPQAAAPQAAAPQAAAPQAAAPTLVTPRVILRPSPRTAASTFPVSTGVKPDAAPRLSPPKSRRARRVVMPDEPQSGAPRPRLRSSRRVEVPSLAPRLPIEAAQQERVAPELQLPADTPDAPRFRARRALRDVAPRIRRRPLNRNLRRRTQRFEEPGLPPAPSSPLPEAGLPPTP